MRIKQRLFLSYIAILFALTVPAGIGIFIHIHDQVTASTLDKLNAIATEKEKHFEQVIENNKTIIKSVRVRSELYRELYEYNQDRDEEHLKAMHSILSDIFIPIPTFEQVTIYNAAGTRILSTGISNAAKEQEDKMQKLQRKALNQYQLTRQFLILSQENPQHIYLADELLFNGDVLGYIVVVTSTESIQQVVTRNIGLGTTGEMLLASSSADGKPFFIMPTKFGSTKEGVQPQAAQSESMRIALKRHEALIPHALDYRGEPVIAATRYIHETDWGIVIKMDRKEAFLPVYELQMLAFGSVVAFLLGATMYTVLIVHRVVKPIEELTSAAQKVSDGQLDVKIGGQQRTDELGVLGRTFHQMCSKLRKTYEQMEETIEVKTDEAVESQKRLEDMVNNTSAVVYLKDINGKYLIINKQFEELFDVKASEFIGKSDYDLFPKKMAVAFRGNDKKVLKDGKPHEFEEVAEHLERPKTYLSLKFPLRDSEGTVYAVGNISTDITQRKALEETKSNFISVASHQLRTPLTSMRWSFDLLMDQLKDFSDTEQRLISSAYASIVDMTATINTMLMVSRIEARTVPARFKQLQLKTVFEKMEKEYSIQTERKKLEYAVSCSDDITVETDENLLAELLGNLMSNAVRYTPEGGRVELKAELADGKVKIHVIDTGIGIPEEQQEQIFTKLFRAENAILIDPSGTGLGLYVSREFVKLLGGDISFVSAAGQGSTFTVTLPVRHKQS